MPESLKPLFMSENPLYVVLRHVFAYSQESKLDKTEIKLKVVIINVSNDRYTLAFDMQKHVVVEIDDNMTYLLHKTRNPTYNIVTTNNPTTQASFKKHRNEIHVEFDNYYFILCKIDWIINPMI